jgi:hypothetical protein
MMVSGKYFITDLPRNFFLKKNQKNKNKLLVKERKDKKKGLSIVDKKTADYSGFKN